MPELQAWRVAVLGSRWAICGARLSVHALTLRESLVASDLQDEREDARFDSSRRSEIAGQT